MFSKKIQAFDQIALAEQPSQFEDFLAEFVHCRFIEARDHKRRCGIEDGMIRDLNAVRGVYNQDELARIQPGEDVYYPITGLKVWHGQIWLSDIYSNADEKVWTLEPTPLPELDPALEEVAAQSVVQEILEQGFTGQDVEKIARETKDLAVQHQVQLAATNTKNHERLLEDQLEEGKWRKVFRDYRQDIMTFPSAILKGPMLKPIRQSKYDLLGNVTNGRKIVPKFERVSPFDIFPSPDATGTQPEESSYIIHRERGCKQDLWDLSNLPGARVEQINKVLSSEPEGHYSCEATDGNWMGDIHADKTNQNKTPLYEVLMYYGRVSGRDLIEHANIKGLHPNFDYEASIIVSGGFVIRAVLNEYPRNRRPFHKTSFRLNTDGFWGTSMPSLLRDVQRKANASVRSLVKNMAFSSGFIAEADIDRMKGEEDIEDLTPGRMYLTTGRGNTSPAIRTHVMPSVAPQLIALQQRFEAEADALTGIPAFAAGQAGNNALPRTTGVLALFLGGASRGPKYTVDNIDKDVLEPAIEMMYDLNMMLSNDPTIKADAVAKARGASGIVKRDLKQARMLEFLQIIGNAPNVNPDGITGIYRQFAEEFGFNPDDFLDDPNRQQSLATRADIVTNRIDTGADVQLDGRSPAAQQALQGQEGLPFT